MHRRLIDSWLRTEMYIPGAEAPIFGVRLMSGLKPDLSQRQEQRQRQRRNAGVLRFVQDDGLEQATASAKATASATTEADPSLRSRMTMFVAGGSNAGGGYDLSGGAGFAAGAGG